MNFLNFSSPIFLAISNVPIFDDLINISSADKFFGNSFISEIFVFFEHLIDLGIFSIIVSGFTRLFSKAISYSESFKIEPNS